MTKTRAWPVRAIYMLLAAALVISLIITAAPSSTVLADAHDVTAEWDRVSTPTVEGWVLAPDSYIADYALDATGEVAYAVVGSQFDECDEENGNHDYLLKSDDHAATWTDITPALEDVLDDDDEIDGIIQVATDWQDGDFVAVALWVDYGDNGSGLHVFFSTDGGDTFVDAGEVEDDAEFDNPYDVADLAVSLPDADGKRDIAIGGIDDDGDSALFRCVVTGDSAGAWEDATDTDFGGWDDQGRPSAFDSMWVTDIIFSPSW
ncbi:MAG: hypothetical protein R6U93_01130, partial [Dehalococcoidia bacterium]